MTIRQFLYETYIGKKITFLVREQKIGNQIFPVRAAPDHRPPSRNPEWVQVVQTPVIGHGTIDHWFRDVEYTERVVEIRQAGTKWKLKTMNEYWITLSPDDEMPTPF